MVLSIKSTCAKGGVLCNGFKYKTIVQQVAAKVLCNAFKYKIIVAQNRRGGLGFITPTYLTNRLYGA